MAEGRLPTQEQQKWFAYYALITDMTVLLFVEDDSKESISIILHELSYNLIHVEPLSSKSQENLLEDFEYRNLFTCSLMFI